MPMMVPLVLSFLHRVDSGSASPQPWRVQGMLSTWCAAPRVVADFARFAPPRHSTMTLHEVNWAHLESLGVILQAKPSQREGGLDDDADYQTAYQSARTVAVNGGRG